MGIVGHDGLNVDASQNADLGHVAEKRTYGEVARGAEVPNQDVEPFDVGVALKNALEFPEKRLLAVVGEKAGGHGRSSAPSTPGNRLWLGAVGGAGRNENVPLFHKPLGECLRENAPGCSKKSDTKKVMLL